MCTLQQPYRMLGQLRTVPRERFSVAQSLAPRARAEGEQSPTLQPQMPWSIRVTCEAAKMDWTCSSSLLFSCRAAKTIRP
jgi:hypothetical protein